MNKKKKKRKVYFDRAYFVAVVGWNLEYELYKRRKKKPQ